MIVLLFLYVSCLLCCRTTASDVSDVSLTFNTSVLEPNKTGNCSHWLTKLKSPWIAPICDQLRAFRSEEPDTNCTSYISEMKRVRSDWLKTATERAAVQYCNGTETFIPCFECFNKATEPLWNKYPCPGYNRWQDIPGCMESFPNANFNWSREVTLRGAHRVQLVSHTSPPYNKCADVFYLYTMRNDFNVTFPIYMYQYSEDEDKEYNIMLSLLMNAFEINNPSGSSINETSYPYGVRCLDLARTPYLDNYYKQLRSRRNPVPDKIINSFTTLRADMCRNVTGCMSCFNRGDNVLLNYTRNGSYRVSSIIDDYNKTTTIYRNCYQEYNLSMPEEYVGILNKSHSGMDKVDLIDCSELEPRQYKYLINHTSSLDTSNMTSKAKVIVDTVAFNVYSYFGYAIRHNGTKACEVIDDGEMLCFFKYTIDMVDRLSKVATLAEEDDDITTFTYSCKSCGSFQYVWYLDYDY